MSKYESILVFSHCLHILHSHLDAVVEAPHVFGYGLAADARVALHVHVVPQGQHHL